MPDRTDIFFALLRAGLWEQDLRLHSALAAEDWQVILQTARQQAVLGLVYRGIAHLPEDQMPPADVRLRLLAEIDRIERRGRRMEEAQQELLRRFRDAGLHPLVQKGSEAGKYYPQPLLRECGDIDLYFAGKEFDQAKALPPGVRTAPDGAGVFTFRDVTVELHSRYFDLHLPDAKLPEVPSVFAELLLLSAHILKHAIGAGVGCKQLCDMAVALDRTDGQYDKELLEKYLKAAGLLCWHRVLCSLLVSDFGLDPARCLPDFKPCNPAPLRRIVLSGGAFGLFDPTREKAVRSGKVARKLQAAASFLKRLPFSLRVAPRETFATIGELIKGNLS
ncbi:MAG: nucleotidyltransferase family protein [Bacteroidales bacterium]|nr:nucleotidyltransferase family protein [Bacteroidales bacterium]